MRRATARCGCATDHLIRDVAAWISIGRRDPERDDDADEGRDGAAQRQALPSGEIVGLRRGRKAPTRERRPRRGATAAACAHGPYSPSRAATTTANAATTGSATENEPRLVLAQRDDGSHAGQSAVRVLLREVAREEHRRGDHTGRKAGKKGSRRAGPGLRREPGQRGAGDPRRGSSRARPVPTRACRARTQARVAPRPTTTAIEAVAQRRRARQGNQPEAADSPRPRAPAPRRSALLGTSAANPRRSAPARVRGRRTDAVPAVFDEIDARDRPRRTRPSR